MLFCWVLGALLGLVGHLSGGASFEFWWVVRCMMPIAPGPRFSPGQDGLGVGSFASGIFGTHMCRLSRGGGGSTLEFSTSGWCLQF